MREEAYARMDKPVEAGHNLPPDMTVTVGEVTNALNDWMRDHPTIASEDEARDAKVLMDRAKLGIADLEAERDGKVRPLNEQVEKINAYYRPSRNLLQKVFDELKRRNTDWIAREEAKRIRAAEEARSVAETAERAAREAEEREQQMASEANDGVVGDYAGAASEADAKFEEYKSANRAARLAERESKVRIGGGFTRALSLRTKETLVVIDAINAITVIGMTPDIEAAILKSARTFRTLHQELPKGVESRTERTA